MHNIRTMKELYTIKNMARNPHGLVTLSSADASFLIYPTSSTSGQVQVVFSFYRTSGRLSCCLAILECFHLKMRTEVAEMERKNGEGRDSSEMTPKTDQLAV